MSVINIYGAGGHAKVVAEIIRSCGDRVGEVYYDIPPMQYIDGVLPANVSDVTPRGPMVIAIGLNEARKRISGLYDLEYRRVIHPSAIISPSVLIDEGSVVMAGAIVNVDTRLGRHCIINTSASVDHDCVISDFVHIAPHVAVCGNTRIGEGSFIGAGSVIIDGITIGRNCMIGAGSVVVSDIPDNTVAYGNPCRPVKTI